MKNKIIILGMMLFSLSSLANIIPTSWFSLENLEKNTLIDVDQNKIKDLEKYTNNLFEINESALNKVVETHADSKWILNNLISKFSLSKDGVLGFSAFNTEASVEITWQKIAPKIKKSESEINSNYQLSDNEMLNTDAFVDDLASKLQKSNKINNVDKFKTHLKTRLAGVRELMNSLPTNNYQNYSPDSFQIEMNTDIAGNVLSHLSANISFTLKLKWKYNPALSSKMQRPVNLKIFKFIDVLLEDINHATSNGISPKGYTLNQIGVELGSTSENNWGLSNTTVETYGKLNFKRIANAPQQLHITNKNDSIPFVDNAEMNSAPVRNGKTFRRKIFQIKRNRMRNGLMKAIKIANFFTSIAAKRQTTKWEISEVETSYSLSKNGIFGLSTRSGGSSLEMTYTKN